MPEKQPTYSKQVIDIADFILKHPEKKREAVIAHFCTLLHKKRRTINTYISQAKEYNQSRIHKQERAKEEVIVAEAKELIRKVILTRDESLEILSNIAKNSKRENSQIRAVTAISGMQGWNAPAKTEINITASDMTREEITAEIERIKKIRDDR